MKLLITGSNGLLGQKISKLCLQENIPFLATSKGENRNPDCPSSQYKSLDICDSTAVKNLVLAELPTHILHTAAMTNVDECELKQAECTEINVEGTRNLFLAALSIGAHLELVSTDFVFDGEKGNYQEDDPVNPLSYYAKSKVEAENILLESSYTNWSIARTIIVYGTGYNLSRSNIVLWAREALRKGEPLKIVDDQFRAPTWADDLAWGCVEIAKRNERGIFHLSGPKTYSIIDMVKAIGAHYNLPTSNVQPVSSSTLNQTAKRPPKTGFDLTKSKNQLNYQPISLEESLVLLEKDLKYYTNN